MGRVNVFIHGKEKLSYTSISEDDNTEIFAKNAIRSSEYGMAIECKDRVIYLGADLCRNAIIEYIPFKQIT